MGTELDDVRHYLRQTLGIPVEIHSWAEQARLPAFLTGRYRFLHATGAGRDFLLLLDATPEPEVPARLRRHFDQLAARWPGPAVYVPQSLNTYARRRLIELGIAFIVPGNQMFLPDLGIDLRERFLPRRRPPRPLRPATQALLIHLLLDPRPDVTAASLSPLLGYTTMTLSRCFDELEAVELAACEIVGRERRVRLCAPPRETWRRAQPWLMDPVKSRHFITVDAPAAALRAGLDGLARYTTLTPPSTPVVAISRRDWRDFLAAHPGIEVPHREDATIEVEAWAYAPTSSPVSGVVEPLSLHLSLRKADDERVEQALDLMMEHVRWSEVWGSSVITSHPSQTATP